LKGATLFLQGEQASRFYMVLKGWVKMFKDNAQGDESVLQVVGVGDCLLETMLVDRNVYLSAPRLLKMRYYYRFQW